ncbi:RDD family protein [Candidatus Nanohaloarchaea archaeon]|nr:RDD family protein [Candidatus Nanohaloarchaea archaeon]
MEGYNREPTRQDTDVIGKRVVAQIVDVFATLTLFFVVLFGFTLVGTAAGGAESEIASAFAGVGVIIGIFSLVGYGFLLEGYWDGQTLGKRLMGIKVVKENGDQVTKGAALVRNIPGITYVYVTFFYIVALISMAASDRRQRLFDRLAGTVVVTEHPEQNSQPQQGQRQNPQQQQEPTQQ